VDPDVNQQILAELGAMRRLNKRAWVIALILFTAFVLSLVYAIPACVAGDRGIVGIFINAEPDFRVVDSVIPDSPAAQAGVRAGDRIISVAGYSTAEMQTPQELVKRAYGPPDSDLELQVQHSNGEEPIKMRLRRVAPAEPRKIPDDFNPNQASMPHEKSNQPLQPTPSRLVSSLLYD